MTSLAAIGLRLHSGWASAVLMAQESGRNPAPQLIARKRIMLCAGPRSKQPYHGAENMELADAEAFIGECRSATVALAKKALTSLGGEAGARKLKGVGLAASSPQALPPLSGILRSHALIHAAEGAFYRQALIAAAERLDVEVRVMTGRAASDFLGSAGKLRELLERIGKAAGPPWTSDEKCASVAALAFLPAPSREFHLARLAEPLG